MASSMHLFVRDEPTVIAYTVDPPFTTPSLTANLICRVLLSIIANLVCLVPMKLLWHNGEFAAVVFILNIELKNVETMVNSLIWRDNDVNNWWLGYGLCDFMPYIHNFTVGLFLTCLLAIMRNLAQQVGMLRANPLTVREKRQRYLVQALIMFPFPIFQVAWVWPITAQRYVIGPLVGCSWISYPTSPYVVIFILAPVVVALLTVYYSILTFMRFREVAKLTSSAHSNNRLAQIRAQRTRRRLYLMVLSILLPFLPIVITLAVLNIRGSLPLRPFNYSEIHDHVVPYKWNTILLLPSESFDFAYTNMAYIPILAAIPVFMFFGMTKDAMNTYRRGFLSAGLGNIFPSLHQEYDPVRAAYASAYGSRVTTSSASTARTKKSALFTRQITTVSTASGSRSCDNADQSLDTALANAEEGRNVALRPVAQVKQREDATPIQVPHRNPFLMRTHLDIPIPFALSSFKSKKTNGNPVVVEHVPLDQLPSQDWEDGMSSHVHTRVWSSDDQVPLCNTAIQQRHSESMGSVPAVMVETELTRESTKRPDHVSG